MTGPCGPSSPPAASAATAIEATARPRRRPTSAPPRPPSPRRAGAAQHARLAAVTEPELRPRACASPSRCAPAAPMTSPTTAPAIRPYDVRRRRAGSPARPPAHPSFLPPDDAVADVAASCSPGTSAPAPCPPRPETAMTELAARVDELRRDGVRLLAGTIVDNAGSCAPSPYRARSSRPLSPAGVGLSPVFAVMCVDGFITSGGRVRRPGRGHALLPDLSAAAMLAPETGLAWAPMNQHDQELAVMETCQRSALRRWQDQAEAAGHRYLMGLECEFTVFRPSPDGPVPRTPGPPTGSAPCSISRTSRPMPSRNWSASASASSSSIPSTARGRWKSRCPRPSPSRPSTSTC